MLELPYPSNHRHKVAVVVLLLTAFALYFPKWTGVTQNHRIRSVAANEFASDPPQIMAEIRSAIETRDLDSLRAIQHKYAGSVGDRKLHTAVDNGMAALAARQTEVQLAVAKMLDTSRLREELGQRHLGLMIDRPSPPSEQELSVLPR